MTYLKTRPEVPTFRRIPLFSLSILLVILLKRGFGIPKEERIISTECASYARSGGTPHRPPSVRWFDLESEKLVIISVSDTYRAELEDR